MRLSDRGPYGYGYGYGYGLGSLVDEDEDLKKWGMKRFMKARRVGRQAQIMARLISMVLRGGGLASENFEGGGKDAEKVEWK